MTPEVANSATQLLALKAPTSARNSPTKPEVPGRPTFARVKDHEGEGIERHALDETAIGGDFASVHAVVNHADTKEQRARYEAVRDHQEHRALDALRVQREQAHRHEAHMRDRRIGDELLDVFLHQRDERGVDNGDNRQGVNQRRELNGGVREHRSEKRMKP